MNAVDETRTCEIQQANVILPQHSTQHLQIFSAIVSSPIDGSVSTVMGETVRQPNYNLLGC